jgi:hypothetical protein
MTRRLVCGAVLLLSLGIPVAARECISSTFTQAAKVYPFVLLGRAVTSKDDSVPGYRGAFSVAEVEVRQVWKGTVGKQVRLYQHFTAERIDFENAIGVDFVIFARALTAEELTLYSVPPNIVALAVDYCASKPAAGQDLTSLGKSRPPVGLY